MFKTSRRVLLLAAFALTLFFVPDGRADLKQSFDASRELLLAGKYDEAIARANEALQVMPNAKTYLLLALIYEKKGDFKQALIMADKSLELDPKVAVAHYHRGIINRTLGNFDAALADFSRAIELDPKYEEAYESRGYELLRKSEFEKGLADAGKIIELNPQNPTGYYYRGFSNKMLDQPDEAIADFNKAIELKPDYPSAYLNRGWAYMNMNDYERALADFSMVIKLDPANDQGYYGRGLWFMMKQDHDQAIADFSRCIELLPLDKGQTPLPYFKRAKAFFLKGEYDKGFADCQTLLDAGVEKSAVYNLRARGYYLTKDFEKAWRDIRKAATLTPGMESDVFGDLKKASGLENYSAEGLAAGIKLKIPEGWQEKDGWARSADNNAQIRFVPGKAISQAEFDKQLNDLRESEEVLSEEPKEILGVPGQTFVFEQEDKDGKGIITNKGYYFLINGIAYGVLFLGKEGGFEKHLPEFEKVLAEMTLFEMGK